MLKLKYLFENYDLAKLALENWHHNTEGLDELLKRYRISSNAVYPFMNGDRLCFLRLAPTEEKLRNNFWGELEFIEYLRENGYPAMEPLSTKNGETSLTLSTEWGEYYASAFACVNGVSLEKTDYSEKVCKAYGRALGRLHKLSVGYVPKNRKWSYFDALDWIDAVLNEYGASETIKNTSSIIRKRLEALPKTAENFGLIHYDFEPDNVFYDEKTDSCEVIDFDDGMYHWYALDLIQAFDEMEDNLDATSFEAAKAAFIRGYSSEREYPNESNEQLSYLRAFITLYAYARLIRSVAERFQNEPDWMVGLRSKLASAIDRKAAILSEIK